MSVEGQEGQTDRALRRSERNKKLVVVEDSHSEVTESETETENDSLGETDEGNRTVVERDSPPESEHSFGEFTTTSQSGYSQKFEEVEYILEGGVYVAKRKKMENNQEQDRIPVRVARDVRSGATGGALPEPTMQDFIKFYVEDQRKRECEERRRLEAEREARTNETKTLMSNQQKMFEALIEKTNTETKNIPPLVPTARLPTLQEGGDVEGFIG